MPGSAPPIPAFRVGVTPPTRTTARCPSPAGRDEVEGFLRGKHGMRRAQGLPPLRPADARQPMRVGAQQDKTLSCVSCRV
ncbi:MAG: hypothetical protein ACREWG_11480 [Gammaproteobacteria bacterium]